MKKKNIMKGSSSDLFVRSICAIYFFAFASLYYQIPGLYSENGILPVHTLFSNIGDMGTCLSENKALLCLAPKLGLPVSMMMELVALTGTFLSLAGLLLTPMRNPVSFFILWLCYFSLHQAGQTFMWFQWDSLLLEIGFLTIFVSKFTFGSAKRTEKPHPRIILAMWLIKWALFRLMFASGVVKLQSHCPAWWSLTALNHHYQSQCIPTSIAWFSHQFPEWFQKLCVVATYLIEIGVPFLFFSPLRAHRLFAFGTQVLLQVSIILTGNYNFFNLLTIVMCFSLFDARSSPKRDPSTSVILGKILIKWTVLAVLVYYTLAYFAIRLTPQSTIESSIEFTLQGFEGWMQKMVPATIIVGALSLLITISEAITVSLLEYRSKKEKCFKLLTTLGFSVLAVGLFGISLVPYTSLDPPTRSKIWPVFKQLHSATGDYEITASYGLFRRMTGLEGRPEVVIEGSDSLSGPWVEYDFKYKPGPLDRSPPFIAPHQPRLDWQMWFAALGSYNQNPWLVSLCYRLLQGEPSVLDLLHPDTPWRKDPPTYIRAMKYTYHFTSTKEKSQNWWTRSDPEEYMPIYKIDHQPLLTYLRNQRYIGLKEFSYNTTILSYLLKTIRNLTLYTYPEVAIWSTTIVVFVTDYMSGYIL